MALSKTILPLVLATIAGLVSGLPGPRGGPLFSPGEGPGPVEPFGGPLAPPHLELPPTWHGPRGPREPGQIDDMRALTTSSVVTEVITSVIVTSSAPSFTVRVVTAMAGAPSTATVTFDAFGNNVDWDAEAPIDNCDDDDEECKKEAQELDEWIEEMYGENSTVTAGGLPSKYAATSLAVRSEPSVPMVTPVPAGEVIYMFGPKGLNPEESASYYSKWGKYAITATLVGDMTSVNSPITTSTPVPTTMVTESMKPKETDIDAPPYLEPVDLECLGMDCGLSA